MTQAFIRSALIAAIAWAVALAFGLTSFRDASAAGPTVSVNSFEATIAGLGKVELKASGLQEPGLAAWTLDLHYDTELLTAAVCEAEENSVCNVDFDPGVTRVAGTNILGLTGSVNFASIAFGCKKAGEAALELKLDVFADATVGQPAPIDAKIVHGTAVCTEVTGEPDPTPTPDAPEKKAGDANCDGEVDPIDAALVLQLDAGLVDSLPCEDNADHNHDGDINSLDAALILQKSAGLLG
jgi:hypothetical protein